jgi:hypothetical protein
MNPLEELARVIWSRPAYQRYFMAFTVGLFLSCAARVSQAEARGARPVAAESAR